MQFICCLFFLLTAFGLFFLSTAVFIILINSSKYAHNAFKQQKHIIKGVYLKLLIKRPPQIALVLIVLDESWLHVDALQVLDGAQFFALVDLLVVLEEFAYDALVGYLVLDLLGVCTTTFLFFTIFKLFLLLSTFPFIFIQVDLIPDDFLEGSEFLRLQFSTLEFFLGGVDLDGRLYCRYYVLEFS